MTNATLASDNVLRFSKKLLEKIQKLIMKIDDKIRDEKLQYEINREEAKIPQLSSSKIDNRRRNITSWSKRVIKQAKSPYSPLAKAFEEQAKKTQKIKKIKEEKALEALEDYGKKLVKSSGEIVFNTLTLIWVVGVIPLPPFPSCWFSFNNSEKIKSVTWHFAAFSNHLLEILIRAKFGICNSPQSLDTAQNSDEGISNFWISDQSLTKENCHNSGTSDDINMELGPVTEVDKNNKATLQKFDD